MLEYIDTKYKPSRSDVVCEYYVEPRKNVTFHEAAEQVAAETSIGTWTDLTTMNKRIAEKLKPHVYYLKKSTGRVKIAYAGELFENANMPGILSGIAGNLFGMGIVNNLRLDDIHFPKRIVDSFQGPRYGIAGVRKLTNIKERPLVGTIVKPKIGLHPQEHATVAYEAWTGGIDVVKDDENLTNQSFNMFKERVSHTLDKLFKAEDRTGEKKVYLANVTAETYDMLDRARYVKEYGGKFIMVDVLTAGWAALQTLRRYDLGLVLHGHRAGHAAFTRNKKHGISMLVIAKLCRLIGIDQLHVGAIVGKMEGGKEEVQYIGHEIEDSLIHENDGAHILEQKWYDIKPTFAVCSGGLHPGKIEKLAHYMGKNIIIQAGGGVHGHPYGTRKGAMAMRQAVEAVMQGTHLEMYARNHDELAKAIDTWGT